MDTLLAFGSNGRVYSVPVSTLPGARGDGQPLTTFVELESGTHLVHYFAGAGTAWLLLSNPGGYGFLATVENLVSRQKAASPSSPWARGETFAAFAGRAARHGGRGAPEAGHARAAPPPASAS